MKLSLWGVFEAVIMLVALAAATLLLNACAEPQVRDVPVEVKVPVKVYVGCTAAVPVEPFWATRWAEANGDIWEQSKTLRAQIVQHETYEALLKQALEVCLKDPPSNTTNQPKGTTP